MHFGNKVGCSFLAALCLFVACQCQRADSDESQIKATAGAFKQAFIEHNAQKLAELLTSDAVDYDLTLQEAITGKNEVAAYLAALFSPDATPEISVQIENITKKIPEIIRVNGLLELQLTGQPKEQIALRVDFKKEEGVWRIAQISHLLLQPAPSHYEHLKDLDWFVGTWVNKDEGSTFSAINQWDMNKNFLTQNFTVKVLGHKQLNGQQTIGWDPVNNTICSWIFDSDGGFGESRWSRDKDSWYVTTKYTLFDGKKSSATHIYKQLDDNTYTFSSVSRDVDGRMLPNIGPFTVIRTHKAPQ